MDRFAADHDADAGCDESGSGLCPVGRAGWSFWLPPPGPLPSEIVTLLRCRNLHSSTQADTQVQRHIPIPLFCAIITSDIAKNYSWISPRTIPSSRHQCDREGCCQKATWTQPGDWVFRGAGRPADWHGSLRDRTAGRTGLAPSFAWHACNVKLPSPTPVVPSLLGMPYIEA